MKIYWIDDDPGRKHFANDIGASFVDARSASFTDELDALLSGRMPKLVILDHFLRNTKSENRMYKRGSTIAEAIKEQWPNCPVIGVTAAANEADIDQRTRLTYDQLFHSYRFLNNRSQINVMADGFAQIKKKEPKSVKSLISLLKPPKDEVARLEAALPSELKGEMLDDSTPSLFYRWVNRITNRAGFLYDHLWVATFLGLNEKGFEKVMGEFERARFTGIFSDNEDPRWWSSLLTEILFNTVTPELSEMSWSVGRRLPNITQGDYSRCYKCRKSDPPPETVAYLDSVDYERRFPMHLEHTALHPGFKREMYFEDIRLMEGD